MIITTSHVDVPADGGPMRIHIAAPKRSGEYPGILIYSDIFQLSASTLRVCARLAGYGFVTAAPEIYHRIEPLGAVIPFDDDGRTRGLNNAARTSAAEFDSDCRTALDYIARHPGVAGGKLGAAGFCIGGHLAFRAAFQPDLRATACFYATGLHDGRLGREPDAGSLARASEIMGELLMVFGESDPHVPQDGRARIAAELKRAAVKHTISTYPAEHAFMRDEGPRYDPKATDDAFREMIQLFRRVFR